MANLEEFDDYTDQITLNLMEKHNLTRGQAEDLREQMRNFENKMAERLKGVLTVHDETGH